MGNNWARVEVRVRDGFTDPAGVAAQHDLELAGLAASRVAVHRVFYLEDSEPCPELFVDPVLEEGSTDGPITGRGVAVSVWKQPGVMDPTEGSIRRALRTLGQDAARAVTGQTYWIESDASPETIVDAVKQSLANEVIEEIGLGPVPQPRDLPQAGQKHVIPEVPLDGLDDEALLAISKKHVLALNAEEMRVIAGHYKELGRAPRLGELETIAQTWSEHCKHKTLTGPIAYTEDGNEQQIENLLKETVFGATNKLAQGLVRLRLQGQRRHRSLRRRKRHLLQGRDPQPPQRHRAVRRRGHGHRRRHPRHPGHRPRRTPHRQHGRLLLRRTRRKRPAQGRPAPQAGHEGRRRRRAGLRQPHGHPHGQRHGLLRSPLPRQPDRLLRHGRDPAARHGPKEAQPGDRIIAVGGRTGRDGIHGATFSSETLHEESDTVSGGAVQIGNPIEEKRVLDTQLLARNRRLYTAVTDCGAGGFSSAVGEMGEHCGAEVWLERAPRQVPRPEPRRDLDQRGSGAHGAGRPAAARKGSARYLCRPRTSRRRSSASSTTPAGCSSNTKTTSSSTSTWPSSTTACPRRRAPRPGPRRNSRPRAPLRPGPPPARHARRRQHLLQGVDRAPVRPRGAGGFGHQAAGRPRGARPRQRVRGRARAGQPPRRRHRLRHQPEPGRRRSLPDGDVRRRRSHPQRRRRRRRSHKDRAARQLQLGRLQAARGAWAPWCAPPAAATTRRSCSTPRSSPARTRSTTSSAPRARPSAFRTRCSSRPWARSTT